jgi:hypothetical protein
MNKPHQPMQVSDLSRGKALANRFPVAAPHRALRSVVSCN